MAVPIFSSRHAKGVVYLTEHCARELSFKDTPGFFISRYIMHGYAFIGSSCELKGEELYG